MTVKELITKLNGMHDDIPVYINQEHTGACLLVQSVEYSDTLAEEDADDDAYMSHGVVLSSFVDEQPRIAPEQVEADTTLLTKLEESVNSWKQEYEMIQKELIDQALIDARAGAKSSRYLALEKREADLKKLIAEGDEKLGKVTGRMMSPGFGNTVQQIVNNAKP